MRGDRISRRRVIQGVGAIGVTGVVGSQSISAQQRNPLDRYIVGVTPGRAAVARRAADAVYRELDFGSIGQAVSGWFTDEALSGLRNNPNVRYVEAEGVMHAIDHTVDEDDGDPTAEQVLPWGIGRVGADAAHHAGETGSGSSVAIIDTGIDPDHETLSVTGGVAFVSARGPYDEEWADDQGHGTHCAGTAAALDNDVGVVGVATEPALYAVKVLDNSGSGSFSDVAAGIEWTADEGIDVGSLSLGADSGSQAVEDACQYAVGKGTLLVAAAGNSGPDEDTVGFPAAYEECIAVSATDENDDIASFSSRGEEVELAAPGVDVLSSVPGDDYDSWNGTSMACPHVAGAGAQLMANGYSNEAARDQLNETAADIGLGDTEQGSGLLDVAAALDLEGESDDDEDDDDEDDEETALAVETREATDVDDSSATLAGELVEFEGHDAATVFFEWGEDGDTLSNTTDEQTLDAPGNFDAELTGLEEDTEYAFRAVAEAGDDSDTGAVSTFTTSSDDQDDEIESDPVIDEFEVTTRSTGPWARADVEWEVSDPDGALEEVTSELVDSAGAILDSETSNVGGSSAAGEHELRTREDPDAVRLTVTDDGGNATSESQGY